MTINRSQDVARTDVLLRTAARDGAVPLPELSAAELCMLCDGGQILVEDAEYAWWYGLAPETRGKLSEEAASLLAFRELLRPLAPRQGNEHTDQDPAPDKVALEMAPELSLIIAARLKPAVLAIGTVDGDASDGTPRLYGLGGSDGWPEAIVAEQVTSQVTDPFGPLHKFALLSPGHAGEMLAAWACRSGPPREISVYHHREGETLIRDTAAVTSDGTTATVSRTGITTAPPVLYDRDGLARLAAAMLNGETL